MRETITISLPQGLRKELDQAVSQEQVNRSDVVREALRDYLAVREFRRLRGILVPLAEERGLFTDQDVFDRIS